MSSIRAVLSAFLFVALCCSVGFSAPPESGKCPSDTSTFVGPVPDEETAICLARNVMIQHYGKAEIEGEAPLHAVLQNGVWVVTSTFHPAPYPLVRHGGVATVHIRQADGKILKVIHGA